MGEQQRASGTAGRHPGIRVGCRAEPEAEEGDQDDDPDADAEELDRRPGEEAEDDDDRKADGHGVRGPFSGRGSGGCGRLPVLSFNGPGDYRLRVHACGRDTAVDLVPDEVTEWYLIDEPETAPEPTAPAPPAIEALSDRPAVPVPAALIDHARKVAAEHHSRTGAPMDVTTLRARLGVPARMAEAIAAHL